MFRTGLVAVLAASITVVTGCNRANSSAQTAANSQTPATGTAAAGASASGTPSGPVMLISPEDLLTMRSNALSSGPSITGSVQPERLADLRAEVSAIVLAVLKEN